MINECQNFIHEVSTENASLIEKNFSDQKYDLQFIFSDIELNL